MEKQDKDDESEDENTLRMKALETQARNLIPQYFSPVKERKNSGSVDSDKAITSSRGGRRSHSSSKFGDKGSNQQRDKSASPSPAPKKRKNGHRSRSRSGGRRRSSSKGRRKSSPSPIRRKRSVSKEKKKNREDRGSQRR